MMGVKGNAERCVEGSSEDYGLWIMDYGIIEGFL